MSAQVYLRSMLPVILLTAIAVGGQQSTSLERHFEAPKPEVEKALAKLHAYSGGKLPTLEGFADLDSGSLAAYKRGYYQYRLQVTSVDDKHTTIRVTAKITAWYTDSTPDKSGYKAIKSNGRLESDLLDSLAESLHLPPGTASEPTAGNRSSVSLPNAPSTSSGNFLFLTKRLATAPSSASPVVPPSALPDAATEKQIKQLTHTIDGLKKALDNQTRPSDLAVVKSGNTAVLTEPVEGSRALMQAYPEDEFQVLDSSPDWVHVQISSVLRGWIRRSQVDLPGAATVSPSALADDAESKHDFRKVKEQVSLFPGKWQPLDGKQVKIIWVRPSVRNAFGSEPKWRVAKTVFRSADPEAQQQAGNVAGVVVVFDSEDGGMAATTMASLQQWRAGHLPDETFFKRCWVDPAEAFKAGQ